MNVMMVTFLFFLIFGIVGQQFWTGEIAACNDGSISNFDECYGNMTISGTDCGMLPSNYEGTLFSADEWAQFADEAKTPRFRLDTVDVCEANGDAGSQFPRVWASKAVNFDGVGHALLTVFEVSSGEMWPDIMYDTTDTVGIGKLMQPNMEPQNALYYIFVQIVCAFLMLNVFVGVVIEKYNDNKEQSEGSALLSNEQKLWVETMKLAMGGKAKRKMQPPKRFKAQRLGIFALVTHPYFDIGIMSCIVLNTILMGIRHFDQGLSIDMFLEIANILFAAIFTVEMLLKLIGIGWKQYIKDAWNCFDGILVILSWIGYAYDLGALASLFRIFRVARMFRLIRSSPGLLNLLKTLIFSLPALLNVGILMVLIKFILACIAMNSFSNVKYGELLNPDANFQTFWLSFNTLWRVTTGESYNGIMHDCALAPPYCSSSSGGIVDPKATNCGNPTISYIYFVVTFTVLNYIMINLFVAIILDNFEDASGMSKQAVTAEHIADFDDIWNDFDPTGTGKIPFDDLGKLLERVDYPLGLKNMPVAHLHGTSLRKHKNRICRELEISHLDGMIDFNQTRRELVKRAMGDVGQDEMENSIGFKNLMRRATRVDQRAIQKLPSYSKSVRRIPGIADPGEAFSNDHVWKANHITSAKIIQAMLRGYWYRKNLDKLRQKWKQQIELARTISSKQALGAPDAEQTLAEASS